MTRSGAARLVGRDRETLAMRALVEGVRAGRGGVLWIEGEPGIGKSALVGWLREAADDSGCAVHVGAADLLLEPFPLRLIADTLGISSRSTDADAVEIAGILAGRMQPGGTVAPAVLATERILSLVDRLCSERPMVLIVEDLHWADEPSILLWNRLARATQQIPLLLVGTSRSTTARPMIGMLRESVEKASGTILAIEPLDGPEVVWLVEDLIGARVGSTLASELSRADGNPLFLGELVGALQAEGQLRVEGGATELRAGGGATPRSLSDSITRRISFLSDATLRTLRSAAVLGADLNVDDLQLVLDDDLLPVIAEAVDAGVLTDAGGRLSFRHDLIRQALVEQVPEAMRTELHDRIARSLAEKDARLDLVARHLLAIRPMPGWAVDWLLARSDAALYASAQASTELLSRAAEALDESTSRWTAVMIRLARGYFWLGDDERTIEATRRILSSPVDPDELGALYVQAVRSNGRLQRVADAVELASAGLAEPALPDLWRTRLTAWLAMATGYAGRHEESKELAAKALSEATLGSDAAGVAFSRHALSYIATDARERLTHIERGLAAVGADPESAELRMLLLTNRTATLMELGRHEEAHAAARETAMLAERVGTYRAGELLVQAAQICVKLGAWDEALVYLENVDKRHLDDTGIGRPRSLFANIALHRGDLDSEHVRIAVEDDASDWIVERVVRSNLAGLRAEANGDVRAALELRRVLLEMPSEGPSGIDKYGPSEEAISLTRLALALDDRATATALLDNLRATLDGGRLIDATAAACSGMIADDVDELVRAHAELADMGWMLPAAFAAEEAAVRAAEQGDTPRARELFTRAVQAFSELGAELDLRRADARLRPLGIRRGPHTLRRRSRIGWDSLTPTELRVARLVARGASNPLIARELSLARSTVETHVSHILGKLSLRSRVELAVEVQQRLSDIH